MSERQRRWLLGGGIGSGKSEVRRLLDAAGIATVDSDAIGHRVIEPDGPAFGEVADEWPAVVTDGRIDRSQLGAIVFTDPAALARLERMTHPHIFGTIIDHVEGIEGPVVVEIPVLDPALGEGWKRIVVDCGEDLRLSRAVARGLSPDDVAARMKSQPSRGKWLAAADLVIPNTGSLSDLEEAVSQVVDML